MASSTWAPWAAAALATVIALVSVWHAAAPTWRRLNHDRGVYARYTDTERRQLAAVHAGFTGVLFDTLRAYVRDGDRIYLQVPRRPYGTLDLHDTVGALARYYLAPAVEVGDPADATLVISYEADPAQLGREWMFQQEIGPGVWVSRVRLP